MNNFNVLLLGQTGSGKTSFAKRLAELAPRAFFFDPQEDYDHVPAFEDFRSAADFYIGAHRGPFHLVYRGELESYVAWLDILYRTQRAYGDPPLAIFLDESSLYSTSNIIDQYLEKIYTQGRKQQINVVTITQRDTQIHPIIRANSHAWVSLRQRKPSTDMQRIYTPDELDRIAQLDTYTPLVKGLPQEGTHYVVDPPEFPIFERFAALMQGQSTPTGGTA